MQAVRILPSLTRALDAALETAFPTNCVSCGGMVDESAFPSVCGDCSRRIQFIDSPKCLTCGFPFFGDTESGDHCMHCEHLKPQFGQGWSVTLFRGPVRGLLHALKYEGGFWALRDIEVLFARAPELHSFVEDAILVPVPLHPRKLRERGYNQSELIVESLRKCYPGCVHEPLLKRSIDTESQTKFNRRDRIRNLRNAFSLGAKGAIDRSKRYIIVDDVFTTGSTLNACAARLRKAGARRLDVLTVGHG